MSAESVLAEAVLARLRTALGDGVNGVFAGPPVKASEPWVELGAVVAVDWGTKTAAGREVRLVLSIRDKAERSGRVHALAAVVGEGVEDLPRDLDGWRVASLSFVRSRIVGDRPGAWSATIEYQVKLLAV